MREQLERLLDNINKDREHEELYAKKHESVGEYEMAKYWYGREFAYRMVIEDIQKVLHGDN